MHNGSNENCGCGRWISGGFGYGAYSTSASKR